MSQDGTGNPGRDIGRRPHIPDRLSLCLNLRRSLGAARDRAAGRIDESLQVRREAVQAAESRALRDLGDTLLLWHYDREANEVYQRAVDLGDSSAYGPLVRRLITERRYPLAIELLLLAIKKGFRYGRRQLGDLYKILGRIAEAETQYADGAAAGDVECRERLIDCCAHGGGASKWTT